MNESKQDLMVIVAGKVPIEPHNQKETLAVWDEMAQASQQEQGCISYHVEPCQDEPNTLVLHQEWESEHALNAHFSSEHMQKFQQKLSRLVTGHILYHSYTAPRISTILH